MDDGKAAAWKLIAKELMIDRNPSPEVEAERMEKFQAQWAYFPVQLQNETDASCEDYRDVPDFRRREVMSPDAAQIINEEFPIPEAYVGWAIEKLKNLLVDPNMRSNPSYAKKSVNTILDEFRHAFYRAFDVPFEKHRPLDYDEMHRHWSKLMYLGHLPHRIAMEAGLGIRKANHVRKSVSRHRERRRDIQWLLRREITARKYPEYFET